METRQVIQGLVADLQPVVPLAVPSVRLRRWISIALAAGAVVVGILGLRDDLAAALLSPPFLRHSMLLLAAAVASASAALTLAVPGERPPLWLRTAPVTAILTWAAWLAAELMTHAAAGNDVWASSGGWGCVGKAFAVGLVPGVALAVMIGRAAPPRMQGAATFAAMAGAAVGAFGVEVTCPLNNPMHLLLWHAAPVATTVMVASLGCWAILTALERAGIRR